MKYFITVLPIHFQPVIDEWKKVFEKEYKEKFVEIKVLNTNIDSYSDKKIQTFRLFNKIYDFASFNFFLSKNKKFELLLKNVLANQEKVFIIPYSTSNLFIKNKKVVIFGPNSSVATYFDNKINAYKLFKKLKIRTPKFVISKFKEGINKKRFVSAAFSSGADQSRIISSKNELNIFAKKLNKINKDKPLVFVDFIEDIKYVVETSAIALSTKKIEVLSVLDEIKRNNACIGNIYPSKISENKQNTLIKITKKIGKHLAKSGFKGMFGCGFFITKKGLIYISDLNPRRQGFYMGDVSISNINIPKLEFDIFLSKKINSKLNLSKKKCKSWSYSLIFNNTFLKMIKNIINNLSIEKLGKKGIFFIPFYSQNNLIRPNNAIGCCILVDSINSKDEIIKVKSIILSSKFIVINGFFLLKELLFKKIFKNEN